MKIYLPLSYSEKVKRPGKNYFLNNIIGEDYLILLLSFTYSLSHLWINALGLFLLQMSFWCIYELGYIENDVIGEKFEDKAVLSYNYKSSQYYVSLWQPWLWSLILAFLGLITISQNSAINDITLSISSINLSSDRLLFVLQELIYWGIFLIILRWLFYIYNHVNKQTRVWLYLILQVFRYGGFLVILTTNTVGLMLLLSTVLTRSIQYILYRYLGGKESSWPMDFPRYFFCLLIYLLLISVMAANERNIFLLINFQVLLVTIFCFLRGTKGFYKVFSQFVPINEDGSNQVT